MMKTCAFLLGVLAFGSVARGQDAEDENIQYEKLKVLEPIIGTWTFTWAGREPTESTYSWSASKKMIVATYGREMRSPVKALRRSRDTRTIPGLSACGMTKRSALSCTPS